MTQQLTEQQRSVENTAVFREAFMNLHMAAVPITMIRTREPFRANDALREFAFAEGMAFKSWSVLHGWATFNKDHPERPPEPAPD